MNQIGDYRLMPPMFERPAKDASGKLIALTTQQNSQLIAKQYAQSGANGLAGYPTTSNIWVVGKAKADGANAILLNGPQFGWFNPAYTYGIGLHGAGFDLVGNTPSPIPPYYLVIMAISRGDQRLALGMALIYLQKNWTHNALIIINTKANGKKCSAAKR